MSWTVASLTFLTGGRNVGGFTDEVISGEVTKLMELGGLGACPFKIFLFLGSVKRYFWHF